MAETIGKVLEKFWNGEQPCVKLENDDGTLHVVMPLAHWNKIEIGADLKIPALGSDEAYAGGYFHMEF